MAQEVAILDFGSGKITVLIGKRGVNNTICMNGMSEYAYDGFMEGEFLNPDQLSYAIGRALTSAQASSRSQIKYLYIGVPGAFTTSVCNEVNINLGRKRAITDADLDALHDQGNRYENDPKYSVVNIQPIYYTLDDERRLIAPLGLKSTKLGGLVSYILAENYFLNLIDDIMEELSIPQFEYISSLLAESLFLFDDVKRDQYVVLIDSGYISTDVVLARGDGILQQFNFPLGGGNISGDLAMYLNISFAQADMLKRKVNLSLDLNSEDKYEISISHEETLTFEADIVNEIVMNRINIIAKTVEKCLGNCSYSFPDYIPYHLTGGGLSYIKGARDYFSKVINKPVEVISPHLPQFNRPHFSSSIGLMDMVLNNAPEVKKGFFAKLFNK